MTRMEREALVLYAEEAPMPGVTHPGSHQIYRHPHIAVERRALPDLAPDHIRAEMIYAGVCGTDLHLVEQDPSSGYIRTSSPVSIPREGRIFGHEGIGRVVAVGGDVCDLKPGAIVALESIAVCGRCDRCRRGHPNQCRQATLVGMQADGIFATVADLPASLAHDVSDLTRGEKDLRALACLEPAGVAWVACTNAGLAAGERMIIFGAGPIGLYCAMLARIIFKAAFIQIVEPLRFRRKFAMGWADQVFSPEEFSGAKEAGFDVAIEASGITANIDQVLRRMNARGRIVALGRSGEPLVLNAVDHMITNAISIMGSRGHLGGAFAALLDSYREGLLDFGALVTSEVNGLGELARLLAAPKNLAENDCKVLVKLQS